MNIANSLYGYSGALIYGYYNLNQAIAQEKMMNILASWSGGLYV